MKLIFNFHIYYLAYFDSVTDTNIIFSFLKELMQKDFCTL